jgi:uncharacterized protein (TIGR03086 family)
VSGGPALLEQAALYALATLGAVGDDDLAAPTPCTAWDLRTLLDHLGDSIDVLTELVVTHRTAAVAAYRREEDPVAAVRRRAMGLIGACTSAGRADALYEIGDRNLPAGAAAGIGAIELTVHGWDIARACGIERPVPDPLAETLWELAAVVVPEDARWPEFGVPAAVERPSSASDRLIAYLGRRP